MLAVVRADDESLVPPQAAGLALSVARPLPTETASLGFGGSPVGGGDKSSRNRKPLRLSGITANAEEFSIRGRETKCFFFRLSRNFSPCTQRYFGVPAWGWYHYPRRELRAVETLDARGSRRRIRRFCAVPEFALCGLKIPSAGTHATPTPNRAHSGSHAETRGGFPARDIGRVDRVNSLGTLCIVTFGTAQLDEPLAVAAAHHGGNADFA